jgi:hypothetical protein
MWILSYLRQYGNRFTEFRTEYTSIEALESAIAMLSGQSGVSAMNVTFDNRAHI